MRCIDGDWDSVARCQPGLTKNGTNITILIKDKDQYEIHIGGFEYTVNSGPYSEYVRPNTPNSESSNSDYNKPSTPTSSKRPGTPTANAGFDQVTPVTPNDADYDIEQGDWRILGANSIGQKQTNAIGQNVNVLSLNSQANPLNSNTFSFSSSQRPGVNLNIHNSNVQVKTKVPVSVNYYDKDRIVFKD